MKMNPFECPPNPAKAFSNSDAPSLEEANNVLAEAVRLSEPKGERRDVTVMHMPAVRAALDGGEVLDVAKVNFLNLPEAKKAVSEKRTVETMTEGAPQEPSHAVAPSNEKRAPSAIQTETYRQMGIAAADRENREAAGLEPRVHNLK